MQGRQLRPWCAASPVGGDVRCNCILAARAFAGIAASSRAAIAVISRVAIAVTSPAAAGACAGQPSAPASPAVVPSIVCASLSTARHAAVTRTHWCRHEYARAQLRERCGQELRRPGAPVEKEPLRQRWRHLVIRPSMRPARRRTSLSRREMVSIIYTAGWDLKDGVLEPSWLTWR